MNANVAILIIWITFTVVALAGVIAVFIWAVRSRQFSDQDRARYLPLMSGIPGEGEAGEKKQQ
jgi:cbb3-type cytochrome oxidase maturation protein